MVEIVAACLASSPGGFGFRRAAALARRIARVPAVERPGARKSCPRRLTRCQARRRRSRACAPWACQSAPQRARCQRWQATTLRRRPPQRGQQLDRRARHLDLELLFARARNVDGFFERLFAWRFGADEVAARIHRQRDAVSGRVERVPSTVTCRPGAPAASRTANAQPRKPLFELGQVLCRKLGALISAVAPGGVERIFIGGVGLRVLPWCS